MLKLTKRTFLSPFYFLCPSTVPEIRGWINEAKPSLSQGQLLGANILCRTRTLTEKVEQMTWRKLKIPEERSKGNADDEKKKNRKTTNRNTNTETSKKCEESKEWRLLALGRAAVKEMRLTKDA